MSATTPAILYLHALPFDGSMWRKQLDLFPTATYTPTLYHCGSSLTDWASTALNLVTEEKIIVVGCSIGGSCALEVAQMAPHRVQSIVLIGTKAQRTPNPEFLASALELIKSKGRQAAWETYWKPLFSAKCDRAVFEAAAEAFEAQSPDNLADGTTAFHSRPSRHDLLTSFQGDITFVTGSDDVAPGVDATLQQARSARKATCHVIPNCGHYIPLEAPDELNDILKRQLSRHFL